MENHYFQPEVECADRESLRELQSQRLREMIKRCYEKVPFYRKKLDEAGIKPEDIKSVDDIKRLPFTTKTDLRDNYPYGLFAVPREELIRIHASSGTTGNPTVVGYTRHDIDVWADGAARALAAAGCTTSDFVHVSYGYGLFTGGLGLHYGAEKLGAAVIPVSSGNTQRQVQILKDFGSNFLCCTPSYAAYIGETCRDMGIDTKEIALRGGIFGAEAWSEGMRENIEKLLNINAYDIYGLSEIAGPGVSYECPEKNGLHVCEDYFYPEIINPETGEVLPDGEYGELVFTCIGKEALPLIRYRTRDICALNHEKCACGRTLVRMAKPHGRMGLEPNYVLVVDRVHNLDTLEVKVEMTPEMFSDSVKNIENIERHMAAKLHTVLNISAKVTLVEPKSIARSEGKAQRIIDNRKI